jgi:DNA processing protein
MTVPGDPGPPGPSARPGDPGSPGPSARPGDPGSPGPSARPDAYVAALVALPGMGPATLDRLLAEWEPAEAWRAVVSGRLTRSEHGSPGAARRGRAGVSGRSRLEGEKAEGGPADVRIGWPEPAGQLFASAGAGAGAGADARAGDGVDPRPRAGGQLEWRQVAARMDPEAWWASRAARGIRLTWPGRADYPAALAGDPERPSALFYRGSLEPLGRLSVAVVGTRSATPEGRSVAYELGRDLAAAGVCVVSGLALGIDGAAHAGALAARAEGAEGTTVGVAASGVDVPYPRRHTRMWEAVVAEGAVVSESLPGRPAQAWRFPHRNRVIAGLVGLVVVVESHARGGSLLTAEAAIARGIEVRAVPGSVRSPASAGTNQLLYDGPGPVRHARDVLDALGLFRPDPGPASAPVTSVLPSGSAPRGVGGVGPSHPGSGVDGPAQARVVEALGTRPATLGQVMERSGLGPAQVEAALDALATAGRVSRHGGFWVAR